MVNKSVKEIIFHKAQLMRNSKRYAKHLQSLLDDLCINDKVEAARVGAVDAMIYDVACSLDFTRQKQTVNDWSSYRTRKKILKELWKSEKAKPKSLRGRVVHKRLEADKADKPDWDLQKTTMACEEADAELSREGLNPAPKFREYRQNKNVAKINAWARGCTFEWL